SVHYFIIFFSTSKYNIIIITLLHAEPPYTITPPPELNFPVTAAVIRRRQESNDYISEGTNDELVSVFGVQSEKAQEKLMEILQVSPPIHPNIPSFHHLLH
ncbi:hypothetical protein TorRG33x02_019450, partial [Trema orientale]